MSRQEAQEVLLLYRPASVDANDAQMQEALELAKHDPELAAWFEQHCQAQQKLAALFKEIQAPEGLKEQILSERKAHLSKSKRRTAVAVFSVCIILVACALTMPRYFLASRVPDTFDKLRERMAGQVQRQYPTMDLVTNSLPQVKQYLAEHQGHGDAVLPPALASASTIGCAILHWHGRTVSMICFNSGKIAPSTAPDLFLFVIRRSEIKASPENTVPNLKEVKGLITATWTAGDKIYLLGGFGDEAFLKKYL